ncbi:hypothetical protein FACS1894206_04850 [Deltaproteobacteria bacterium]|nr:hypothetical protein FACS1894206_04850 [Deltaproteobacteria bacterium]
MKKSNLVNTDFWGAGIMFLFAVVFYSQMDPDFTHYAAYFPNHLIPCLVVLGVALIIKGFVTPTMLPSFLSEINSSMVFAMTVGLLWVFTLDWLGFLITSFAAIFALLWRFEPAGQRTPARLAKMALIAGGEVGVIYVVFVRMLYVTMPEGRLFY